MSHNPYIYILIMAAVTFAIRVLPLTLVKKQFTNTFVRSFLYYVPYVTSSIRLTRVHARLFLQS